MMHAADFRDGVDAPALGGSDRAAAFDAARRHSRRVRRLKIAIVAGSVVAILSLAFVGLYDPFRNIPADMSVARASLDGTKITMEHPKLSGYRRDGRPYQLLASSAVQDVKHPAIVELNDIDARVSMPDDSILRLRAPEGVYDATADFMRLPHDILVTSTTGYQARLRSATVDFKAGAIHSKEPVTVRTANSSIMADALSISGNGDVVDFVGDVRSTILPRSAARPGRAP